MRRILAVGRNTREHELLFSRAADGTADRAGKAEGNSQSASRPAENLMAYLEDMELPPPDTTSERFLDVLL
jgi:hypothetical protein